MQGQSPAATSARSLGDLRDESVPQDRVYSGDSRPASHGRTLGSPLRDASRAGSDTPAVGPGERQIAVPSLLSPQEVSHACGLSLKVVYRAIRSGELRASRFGRCLKVRPSELDAWIDRCALRLEQRPLPESDLPARLAYAAPNGLRTMVATRLAGERR